MSQQNQLLDFIARLCLIVLFPFSALNKIFDHQSAMAQAANGLIPLPPAIAALLLVLGGILEVLGPVCILLGFLSAAGGAAVHILCHRDRGPVPQFLELSIQRRCLESEFLAIPQEFRAGRWISLHCRRCKDAIPARRFLAEPAIASMRGLAGTGDQTSEMIGCVHDGRRTPQMQMSSLNRFRLLCPIRFPRAICGDLGQAERREWWIANGLAGYAGGTIAGSLTRRYHGLLIAPVASPLGRRLILRQG